MINLPFSKGKSLSRLGYPADFWVQGNLNVVTSWSGLVALLAFHYYNAHPLLTAYKTR